jgi:hypothetical protein
LNNLVRATRPTVKSIVIERTNVLGENFKTEVLNTGAGALSFVAADDVTLHNNTGTLTQWKRAKIESVASDEYVITYYN